jgi:hypothetical protein
MRTETKPPSSSRGKWTFLWGVTGVAGVEVDETDDEWPAPGVLGAETARICAGEWVGEMAGEEQEDFREDFNGLPLERKIGVELVLEKLGLGEFVPGESSWGDCGFVGLYLDEEGKGIFPAPAEPKEGSSLGFSLRLGFLETMSSSESESDWESWSFLKWNFGPPDGVVVSVPLLRREGTPRGANAPGLGGTFSE